ENGWSVRQVESYTGEQKKPAKRRKSKLLGKNKDRDLAAVEQQVTEALGTKVRIRGTEKKGKLELEYYSRGELERLIEILSSAQ
ncbi:MAG: chromosome partitioning protein ParB, partial [Firmicutes bacterium]|nr:chromosome partitioning protein ParB [Bacillota bacterium]